MVEPEVEFGDVIALVAAACRREPDLAAIRFEDGIEMSRRDFRAAIERFAGHLSQTIVPGERVAIVLENRIEFMVAWLAVVASGGTLVSVNPASGPVDARHILRDCSAAVAIVSAQTAGLLERVRSSLPSLREVIEVGSQEPRGLDGYCGGDAVDLDSVQIDVATPTNVYYTSGTTGRPKGCQLGHEYWLRFVSLWHALYGLQREDRLMCCVPFFYGDAPWELLASLHGDSTLIVMRRFSVSRFWRVVSTHRVTQLFTLASMPALLLKASPSPDEREHKVRFAVHVGIPANLHRQMHERWGFPWAEGYGLTETGLVIGVPLHRAEDLVGTGAIGLPVPGVEARLVSESGAETSGEQPGEIAVRAPGMMRGYLDRPQETARTVRDGWLYTGDLGRRDADGYYHFLGRRKDIVRRSGENVAAGEVEAVVREHPLVRDAAVLAVADELRGEEIALCVESVDPQTQPASAEDLVEFCRDRLARHKVPRYVEIRSAPLPRTASMRVDKPALRAEVASVGSWWDRTQELGW